MEQQTRFSVALFDIDGTLLDSAALWEDVPERYMAQRGIAVEEQIDGIISKMGFSRSARYLQERYIPNEDPHAVMDAFCAIAAEKYRNGVKEKPAAVAYLNHLCEKGVPCAAVTSNMRDIVLPALEKLHMLESLDSVTSIYYIGMDKHSPKLFQFMAEKLGVAAEACVVFEDTLFAAESTKRAGMCVIGVYDRCADALWNQLCETADRSIFSYEELIEQDVFA